MLVKPPSIGLSPKGPDILALDDGLLETKRLTTFGVLTRRFTTTFIPRSNNDDYGKLPSNCDDSVRQIKMQILNRNPTIYQMFRKRLVEEECYTDITVCYMLNHFLDHTIRVPEFRDDIITHRLAYSTHRSRNSNSSAIGIFAYLTGESSPPITQKQPIQAMMTMSGTPEGPQNDTSSQCTELSLPSLGSSGHTSDRYDMDQL
jgi:hypothetical protein